LSEVINSTNDKGFNVREFEVDVEVRNNDVEEAYLLLFKNEFLFSFLCSPA